MKKQYFLLLLVTSALSSSRLQAQTGAQTEAQSKEQSNAQPTAYTYDKEKIYIQTDHVFFAPGTTIFFKIYLVRGADNKPSSLSNIVYAEIVGPSGTTLEKQTYQVENGYSEGSYTLGGQAAGGVYKIKAYTSWMLNEKDSTLFTKTITVQNSIAPRVLMKLDFRKKGYSSGDTAMADFSMRNLDNEPIKYYNGQFTVSLDGQTREKSSFTTDANGKAALSFTLPQNLQTADGLLNITVNYDSHTESIARSIPITLNKIDLQFLPEGGAIVEALATNIAFKAINEFGKPVDVKGVILDKNKQPVATFDSYQFGMGSFPFTPRPGETYTAKITSPANIKTQYALPTAAPQGVVMNITKNAGLITIKCSTSSATAARIIGQTKSVTYYSKDLQLKKGVNDLTLQENSFPAGIAQFTLYTGEKPLTERLIFLSNDKQLHVSIFTDKQQYLPREKVTMTITTRDQQDHPIPSNFSLSVVDDKLWTLADDRQDNILSWLLMSSELRGPIEEPPFYFKKDEPKAALSLDLVMLTNGYRYFDFIDQVIHNRELKFTPDESNIVSGIVTNEKDQPIPATIFLISNKTNGKALKGQTGADGRFYFPNMVPGDNYILIARSLHKSTPIKLIVEQNGVGYNPLRGAAIKQLLPIPVAAIPQPQKVNLAINFDKKANALNEVVVVGYGTMRKMDITGAVTVIQKDELKAIPPNGILQALEGKVAGLEITPKANPGETPAIRIRGAKGLPNGNEPLIIVDGVPQEKYDLTNININDIASVTVIKDAEAIALYGARAANGVIAIQTKKPRYEQLRFNITRKSQYATQSFIAKGPGLTVARRFYSPQYQSTVTDERNDYRETIYWNPVVQTNSDGSATVEFYNSDASTTFRTIAEGIGNNGQLGRVDTTYTARAAMSVDAKIPPYLTVGDQALLPIVIKNNSGQKLDAAIAISLPENMYAGSFNNAVSLDPGASQQVLVPIAATATAKGNVRINVTSNLSNETTVLPISAADKGFPIIETFSGNNAASHSWLIGQVAPGSLQAKLTLYKDVEGQLMAGIESMLCEPHGCFEQTSSSTYPNIFILKYLRQSGRSNPEIEKKAMQYIEDGYKRLIGYETAEHGFEWFGHTPAHAALTAYGLLEFTDMQEFLNVDKDMLQRTKDFLLSRRDGQGGFKISSSGYDQFAAVPDKIANIYIVYSLTQAGFGDKIAPEYTAALKKAIESNDAYQLSMMALAASNIKKADDYKHLMDQLNANYRKYSLSAETSVVNSRDISLRVETMSLYALALMRDREPDLGTVAALISKILSNRSYYGYGSTQGTVLALQAVTEYTKLAGEQAKTTDIRFTVNGRTVSPGDSIATWLHPGQNTFTVEYPGKERGIPYNLEVSYQTLTPPNSEKADLLLNTSIGNTRPKTGETVRMTIAVTNKKNILQPMAIAKIGIPAGLSLQPWQLKELMEKKQVAYYEIFDNYLVLYWMGFAPKETKTIALDLKAEIPGKYKGKASNVYLYYTPEAKHWNEGLDVEVQ